MSGEYIIQSLESWLYVVDDGQVNTGVILIENPANLQLTPPPLGKPPSGVAIIKGRNGFYINLNRETPPRKSDLAWSLEPCQWTFANDQIFTVVNNLPLFWFLQYTDSWNITLNPIEGSRFRIGNAHK